MQRKEKQPSARIARPKENTVRWARWYIDAVINNKIPVCHWVRQAVKRHTDDLKQAGKRGYYFDERAADKALSFFMFLHHSKGEWAGQPFILSPWQQFIIYCVFGWKRKKDGHRRYTHGYVEVPRKNGKSTMAAGIGLYMLDGDGEPGAEVYSVATTRDQAKIVHGEATRMVKSSDDIKDFVVIHRDNLHVPETASKFEPLSADYNTMDGLNPHCSVADELHAHKTRDVLDLLDTATGARRQPLLFMITTAGVKLASVGREMHEHAEKVLDGVIQDDSFFAIIYTIDVGDDWEDEVNWIKANPNLGVSVKVDDLRRKAERAKSIPSALNAFLRLHLNVWTQAESAWITPKIWNASAGEVYPEELRGRKCYGGLDLSTTTDISALTLSFPMDDGSVKNLYWFWIPKDRIDERVRRDRVPYDVWVREGYIEATDGNVIDYDFIEYKIMELSGIYDIQEMAYDPWNATEVVNHLMSEGLEMVQFRQGFQSMGAPTKRLEIMVLDGKYHHGSNPVMNWMMSNVAIQQDPAGNIKIAKDKSREKVDGPVSAVMSLGRVIAQGAEPIKKSVYEERGMLML